MERVENIDPVRRDDYERSLAAFLRDIGYEANDAQRRSGEILRDLGSRFSGGIEALTRYWWVRLLQGVLAICVGAMFFARPDQALEALVLTLGVWAIIDGIALVIGGVSQRSWYLALGGAAGLAVGYLVLTRPVGAAVVFYYLTAIWVMARGISEIAFGASMPVRTSATTAIIVLGILSFLFGLALLLSPMFGVPALAYTLGIYAVAYGTFLVVISLMVRSKRRELKQTFTRLGHAQPLPT